MKYYEHRLKLYPKQKIVPVVGASFYYHCLGCGQTHLSMGTGTTHSRDSVKTYTVADLNGEPFRAYYCVQTFSLTSADWQDMLDDMKEKL